LSHKKAQKAQSFLLSILCLFVALSKPTNKREAFATSNRHNFMKNVGLEGDEQSGFTHQRKGRRLIVKGE
jgi:hypothetical protein